MLKEGDKAPEFQLQDDSGKEVSLKDLKGKKVVLYFYPKDDTPGCTKEACSFRDDYAKYKKMNAVIFGVSKDPVDSHKEFKTKYSLPFPLLVDPDAKLAQDYGAWGEKNMYGKKSMGLIRSTYVIDENGKLEKIYRNVKVDGHSEAILGHLSGK
ncbi:MAG TPA: thioredoxin-dependent thiol peroxidase [Bdellovibrionota bacterium]|nr:thioredoxin-dependent thiol peroxidase [Bdellovibrionota bacterium]